jgi:hypothetical protein
MDMSHFESHSWKKGALAAGLPNTVVWMSQVTPDRHMRLALRRPATQLAYALRSLHNGPVDTPSLYNQIPDPEIDSLLTLVRDKRFGAAERLLNNIIDARRLHRIVLHPAYESAALAALQWDDRKRALRQFSMWFKLVPDINHPNAPPTQPTDSFSSTPFYRTISTLMQSGNPMFDFPIIKQFALICASKGYIHHIYNWVVEPLPRIGDPAPPFVEFLDLIEAAAVKYEAAPLDRTHNSCMVAGQLRVAAFHLLCRLGWYRRAQDVLTRNAADQHVILPDEIYEYFLRIGKDERTNRPAKTFIDSVQSLRRLENAKRLKLEYLPRRQVRVQLADMPPTGTPYSKKSADIATRSKGENTDWMEGK